MNTSSIDTVDTPAPLLDEARLGRNIVQLQTYCDEHGVALWPHTKTHKSAEIARRQLQAGARGLTAAKPTEAAAMLESAAERLLIAYPVLGPQKAQLVAELAGRCDVSVALDSFDIAHPLAAAAHARGTTVGILIELDVGLHRIGTQGIDDLLALAQRIAPLLGLEIQGVACYPGHLRKADELADGAHAVDNLLKEASQRSQAMALDPTASQRDPHPPHSSPT